MIGVIISVSEQDEKKPCGDRLRETGVVQLVEAVVYALKLINGDLWDQEADSAGSQKRSTLGDMPPSALPNDIRLGAVIVDDCNKPVTSLARALHFLPVKDNYRAPESNEEKYCFETCRRETGSSIFGDVHQSGTDLRYGKTMVNGSEKGSTRPKGMKRSESAQKPRSHRRTRKDDDSMFNRSPSPDTIFYDVIGVVGPEGSTASVVVANLLGTFRIPQISPTASSDALSDKTKFPYFLRMAPPDRHQVDAMVNLINHFKWTYIAAVYSKGSYGESAIERLKAMAPGHQICVGPTLAIAQNANRTILKDVVMNLVNKEVRLLAISCRLFSLVPHLCDFVFVTLFM